ncbi:MAG: hydroxymethylglutaryl-CoA reductase, partial [Saprospiraceae bacterium]
MNVEQDKMISGFSKLTKTEKIQWIARQFFHGEESAVVEELMEFWHEDGRLQKTIDGFSENTISNFYMPYGVAPNFLIDGKSYCVPMVIEESSVVAAAAAAAKFWMTRGGFQTEILGSTKIGQVHFSWKGNVEKLRVMFPQIKKQLLTDTNHITHNMRNRGGGVSDIELLDFTHLEAELYQLRVSFETCDSMGANFINSVLEEMGRSLVCFCGKQEHFTKEEKELTIIMAILSNYTPNCVVRASVECSIEELGEFPDNMSAETFAEKFYKAVRIATIDPYRATTHNKGIFNGIDSVILATANDFRAIEAGGHTYASQSGQYRSLSHCTIVDGIFKFWLDIPLAVGTVGGLTKLHPLAKRSLQLLDNPTAHELMSIIATVGLAQNFAALRSL